MAIPKKELKDLVRDDFDEVKVKQKISSLLKDIYERCIDIKNKKADLGEKYSGDKQNQDEERVKELADRLYYYIVHLAVLPFDWTIKRRYNAYTDLFKNDSKHQILNDNLNYSSINDRESIGKIIQEQLKRNKDQNTLMNIAKENKKIMENLALTFPNDDKAVWDAAYQHSNKLKLFQEMRNKETINLDSKKIDELKLFCQNEIVTENVADDNVNNNNDDNVNINDNGIVINDDNNNNNNNDNGIDIVINDDDGIDGDNSNESQDDHKNAGISNTSEVSIKKLIDDREKLKEKLDKCISKLQTSNPKKSTIKLKFSIQNEQKGAICDSETKDNLKQLYLNVIKQYAKEIELIIKLGEKRGDDLSAKDQEKKENLNKIFQLISALTSKFEGTDRTIMNDNDYKNVSLNELLAETKNFKEPKEAAEIFSLIRKNFKVSENNKEILEIDDATIPGIKAASDMKFAGMIVGFITIIALLGATLVYGVGLWKSLGSNIGNNTRVAMNSFLDSNLNYFPNKELDTAATLFCKAVSTIGIGVLLCGLHSKINKAFNTSAKIQEINDLMLNNLQKLEQKQKLEQQQEARPRNDNNNMP